MLGPISITCLLLRDVEPSHSLSLSRQSAQYHVQEDEFRAAARPSLRLRDVIGTGTREEGSVASLFLRYLDATYPSSLHQPVTTTVPRLVVCLRRAEVILLADFQAGLPENVVGGGDVEVHVGEYMSQ
jgi:hypothetical protein